MYCVYVVQMSMSMYLDLHTSVLHNSVYMCTQICVHLLMNTSTHTTCTRLCRGIIVPVCISVLGQESWEGL